MNCEFDELDKLKDEFDELDKLKDEFDELDALKYHRGACSMVYNTSLRGVSSTILDVMIRTGIK